MARERKNNKNGSYPSFEAELFLAADKLHKYGYQPDLQGAAIQTVPQQAEALSAE